MVWASTDSVVYEGLKIAMEASHVNVREMAKATGMSVDRLSHKLRGEASFKLEEAAHINTACFPEYEFEFLFTEAFKSEKEKEQGAKAPSSRGQSII